MDNGPDECCGKYRIKSEGHPGTRRRIVCSQLCVRFPVGAIGGDEGEEHDDPQRLHHQHNVPNYVPDESIEVLSDDEDEALAKNPPKKSRKQR